MDISRPNPASTEDALRYVLSNVGDERAALETANSAIANATTYGRIAVAVITTTGAEATKGADPARNNGPGRRVPGAVVDPEGGQALREVARQGSPEGTCRRFP